MKTFRYDVVLAENLVATLTAAEAEGWVIITIFVHQYQVEGGDPALGVCWYKVA